MIGRRFVNGTAEVTWKVRFLCSEKISGVSMCLLTERTLKASKQGVASAGRARSNIDDEANKKKPTATGGQ